MKVVTRIIFGLAQLADFTSDFVDIFSPYNHLLYTYPSNKTRVKDKLESLLAIGQLDKKVKNGKIYYRLTSKGMESLYLDIPVLRYSSHPWDHLWRIVIYDIPEEQHALRKKLQYKLKVLSFGQWQKSVWVTPHPVIPFVRNFLASNHLDDYSQIYEAKSLAGNARELAKKIWKLDELNSEYMDFFIKIKSKSDREKILEEYEFLLLSDPGLPKELLPSPWYGSRVRQEVFKLI